MPAHSPAAHSKNRDGIPLQSSRRYDVDWLRVIALGLLIVYHIAITFYPWASALYFPQNKEMLGWWLWILMSMINVWRIPLLFTISGMSLAFAMSRRGVKTIIAERSFRLMIPFVFGVFAIAPLNVVLFQRFFSKPIDYVPNAGHLWFLLNIYLYVIVCTPLILLFKKNPNNRIVICLQKIFRRPALIYLFAIPIVIEALFVIPDSTNYVQYVGTAHGYLLGLLCFLYGFLFVGLKEMFWNAVARMKFVSLAAALSLYATRLLLFELDAPNWLIGLETMPWIFALLGFASSLLNKPSRSLTYLNQALFPIYLVHLPLTFLCANYIFPLSLSPEIKLALLLLATCAACVAVYEIIKRIRWIHPLFGLKSVRNKKATTI